jgi:hypothetical protein
MYGEEPCLRVGDLCEVVGILTVDPPVPAESAGGATDMEDGQEAGGDASKRIRTREAVGSSAAASILVGQLMASSSASASQPVSDAFVLPRVQTLLFRRLCASYPLLQPPLHASTASSFATHVFQRERERAARKGGLAQALRSAASAGSGSEAHSSLGAIVAPTAAAVADDVPESPRVFPFGLKSPTGATTAADTLAEERIQHATALASASRDRALAVRSAARGKGQSASSEPSEPVESPILLDERLFAEADAKTVLSEHAASQLRALTEASEAPCRLVDLRDEVLRALGDALGGDAVAAEFLLLFLLSHVASRRDVVVVGCLSLGLTGFPGLEDDATVPPTNFKSVVPKQQQSQRGPRCLSPRSEDMGAVHSEAEGAPLSATGTAGAAASPAAAQGASAPEYCPLVPLERGASACARRLSSLVAQLMPRSLLLPVRLDSLCTLDLSPFRLDTDDSDRLHPGLLQLAPGTVLVLDESVLAEGQLDARGTRNVQVLQEVVSAQTLQYRFPYMDTSFPVDLPSLVLAHGNATLVKADLVLPLSPNARQRLLESVVAQQAGSSDAMAETARISSELVAKCRLFLAACKYLAYSIPADVAVAVEDDLVRIKQESRAGGGAASGAMPVAASPWSAGGAFTVEDLHRIMTIARLCTLSFGQNALSMDTWKRALELERTRRERLYGAAKFKQ